MTVSDLINRIVAILIVMQALPALAQSYWSNRYDLDAGNDYGTYILISDSQDIIIPVKGFCEINTRECDGIICIDGTGNMKWKTVVYDSLDSNGFETIFLLEDIILYNVDCQGECEENYSILYVDPAGMIINRHDYSYPSISGYHRSRSIDGYDNKIFVGFSYRPENDAPSREIRRAYDRFWNILWEVSIPNTQPYIRWADTEATHDGGLVVAYSSTNSEAEYMCTVEKYDSTGDMEWQTVMPHVGDWKGTWVRIDNHPTGDYVGVWHLDTFAFHATVVPSLVFRLDQDGNILWERMNLTDQVWLYDIFSAKNGDIVGCGVAEEWYWDSEADRYHVGYVARYDAQGEKRWDRKISDDTEGANYMELYSGAEFDNGDLVFTGLISDTIFGTPDDPTPDNVWVLKLDSMGCLTPGCGEWQHIVTSIGEGPARTFDGFVIYPNPASEKIILGARLGAHIPSGEYHMVLYDLHGHMILKQEFNPLRLAQFDLKNFEPGQYIATVWRNGGILQSIPVLIE